MKKMFKFRFKRLAAAALSILMLAGLAPTSAFAAGNTAAISFGYMYQSDGSQIKYQDSFVGTHGTDGAPGRNMTQIYANGQEAYCIEPGAPLHTGDSLTANASETWNALGADKQNGVKLALAFGKPGNAGALPGSADAKHLATQMVVWEIVCGYRNTSSFELANGSIYNAFCKNDANGEVAAAYNTIVGAVKGWNIRPSFANGGTYEMSWRDNHYTATLTDSNRVLGNYAVSVSDSNVKVTRSGNSITLTSNVYMANNPTITLTKTSGISASAVLVPYGSTALQDVVTGVARVGDVIASFKLNTPGGTLKVVKNSEDGIVSGIQMRIQGQNYDKTVTTDENGQLQLEGVLPGEYTVTEYAAEYYEPQAAQTITIKGGETTTVTFNNVLKRGNLSVTKTSEDGFTEGMRFHLFGTSASGTAVDEYAVTDAQGVAVFNNILVAGAAGYTLEEVDTAVRYVVPDDQNVRVNWQSLTETQMSNILKKFRVTVSKSDIETGTAQGDAKLSDAVYGLYRGNELVETLTTGDDSTVTSAYHICGDDWTVREITPSEGYLVDENIYSVGAEAEEYTVELNDAPGIASYEQVIKGNVAIIKHSDDGSTQIETPEEGAVFQIYLASAGSYDAAKESERDTLVCDADGFAMSKDLPYGLYTVHQTEGWEETEFMDDFTVFISENGKTYKYLINNAPYSAYIRVVKADKETGNTIPLTGAGFEIYDEAGNKISMSYTYPTLTTIDTYYVSADGYLLTPQKLDAGNYTLVEVQAPYGYVLDTTPIPFTVTMNANEDLEGLSVITVTAYDLAQKGRITITKSGEVFAGVNVSGETGIIDKEGNEGIINPIYSAVYEMRNLEGAVYQVIADEDIYTGDGTLRASAGTVAAELTTDENGTAVTEELYLGRYKVVEVQAPDGMVLNSEEMIVELTYAGQEISVTAADTGFVNDRQKVSVNVGKSMEEDELFGLGMNGEVTAVSFGLYAKEAITAADGSVIPADGLMEIAFADENGEVQFTSDLPFGTYYVKELSTDVHYSLSDAVYEFTFDYAGQEIALQNISLNDGTAVNNTLKRGRIEGIKVNDETAEGEERGLAGAVFGLFAEGTLELDAEHAILTAVSDENGAFAFEDVPYGDYVVVELTAPESYVLSDARHFVSITYDEQRIGLKVINYPVIGSVQLTKIDKDYPENHLAGAVFEIYADTDGNGEFDAETDVLLGEMTEYEGGIYQMDGLRYGSYFVKEKSAPEGFLLDENVYAFSIVNDKEVVTVENEAGVGFMNQVMKGRITIFKTDKASGEKLVGAGFAVFDKDGNKVAEGVTGEDGKLGFELRYGEYTVCETSAPEGYVLDTTPYSFSITEDGQELSVDMSNTRIKGRLVISKVDADTEKLLPNAGFRIYAADGQTVVMEGRTDKNGICEFELEFGRYFYQEFDAPEGYEIDDTKYEFSITEDGQVVSVKMENERTPENTPDKPAETTTPQPGKPSTSTDGPKTGDDSNVRLWSAIAGAAAIAGMTCICVAFKKRKKDDDKSE